MSTSKTNLQLVLKLFISGTIKYFMLNSEFQSVIADRIEVSTPLNSWKRATEAITIYEHHIDPYVGDVFHDTPLNLRFYTYLHRNFSRNVLNAIFVLCDTLTALLLYLIAKTYTKQLLHKQDKDVNGKVYQKNCLFLLLSHSNIDEIPNYVITLFLFNPFLIFNCVGRTTTTFTNLFLAIGYFGMVNKIVSFSCIGFALASCQTLYPSVLIIPTAFYLAQDRTNSRDKSKLHQTFIFIRTIVVYCTVLYGLLYASYVTNNNNWSYLDNVYGLIVKMTDLRPNIGIAWYFFTEMFDHFHLLFIYSFQINVCILYVIPLSIRFHNDPMLLAACFNAIIVMFRGYPSVGDVGFYLALFPMWKHLFAFMQQNFIVYCIFLITSVIAPVFWHLWIYTGAANANFYFGITLAFAVAQIFLITDLLFAYIKREYFLINGFEKCAQIRFK